MLVCQKCKSTVAGFLNDRYVCLYCNFNYPDDLNLRGDNEEEDIETCLTVQEKRRDIAKSVMK